MLHKLTPAESLVLLNARSVNFKELMMVTFLDLVVKGVIKVLKVRRSLGPGINRVMVYDYVTFGANFDDYKPLAHESVFTKTVKRGIKPKFINQVIDEVVEEVVDVNNYMAQYITDSPGLKPYFTSSIVDWFTNNFAYNEKGLEARKLVLREVNALDKELAPLLKHHPNEALEIFIRVRGNLFLTADPDLPLLEKFGALIKRHRKMEIIDNDIAYSQNAEAAVYNPFKYARDTVAAFRNYTFKVERYV